MDFGVACHHDGQVVTILMSDQLNQVNRIIEAIFIVDPVFCAAGWVAPQREKVPDALFFCLGKAFEDLLASHERASDVHQDV